MNLGWLNNAHTNNNMNKILKGWIGLGNKFHMKTHDKQSYNFSKTHSSTECTLL